MESATTNLAEVNADVLRLFNTNERRHYDIRSIFVHKSEVTQPATIQIQVGDEIDTSLQYENPTNHQVPALHGLLSYIDQQYPGQPITKYYTTHRKHTHHRDGDTHTTLFKRITQKRDVRVLLDMHSTVVYHKTINIKKVSRPIFIFSSNNGCFA